MCVCRKDERRESSEQSAGAKNLRKGSKGKKWRDPSRSLSALTERKRINLAALSVLSSAAGKSSGGLAAFYFGLAIKVVFVQYQSSLTHYSKYVRHHTCGSDSCYVRT